MTWDEIRDVACAVLMLTGAAFCLLGAVGLIRLPDLPARLQAATKPQTLGLLLILLGTALRVGPESAVTLILVVLLQVLTAPVISQIVGRSAYRTGTMDRDRLLVDDLDAQMRRDRHGPGDPSGDPSHPAR